MDSHYFNQDDRSNWELMKKGDTGALAALFRTHYQSLYDYGIKLCYRDDLVKDIIQEMFIYIWEKRQNLSEVSSVKAYLFVTFRRKIFNSLHKLRKRQNNHQALQEEFEDSAFSPEDFAILQETNSSQVRILQKALEKIPVRMREALYLKTFSGLSYKEIASIMDISPQVARNYVSEAFQRLKNMSLKEKLF